VAILNTKNLTLYNLVLFILGVVYFPLPALALDKNDPLLYLPSNLPPSLYASISKQPIFNVISGKIRFVPRVDNSNAEELASRLSAYNSDWQDQVVTFMTTKRSKVDNSTIMCDCQDMLEQGEYFISEMSIKQIDGHYLSLNDESYKAIMELIDYPLESISLRTVAFSELAYVYNADAIEQFLEPKGFELIMSRGMMNSSDYPGYRDTQFMLIRQIVDKQIYVVIRGTSGVLDIDTNLDAKLISFGKEGKVHRGYADIASYIFKEITPYFPLGGPPWVFTGHSLGGSVAILLSELMSNDHRFSTTITYAPVPLVDFDHYNYRRDLDGSITNFFLPNEELDIGGRKGNWLYLPGIKQHLEYVGRTAGAAHFVINYLKSRLIGSGFSKTKYEESLPHCVYKKYACFNGSKEAFLPACILFSDICLAKNIELLLGFYLPKVNELAFIDFYNLEEWRAILPDNPDTLILEGKYRLVKSEGGSFNRNVILAELTLLNILVGNISEARRMHKIVRARFPEKIANEGIVGLNEKFLKAN